jgi:hypothetical protein
VNEGEQVSAYSGHGRLDDREHGRRGDGGIDGVSPVLEDAKTSRRGKGLARRNDPPPSHDDRAGRA